MGKKTVVAKESINVGKMIKDGEDTYVEITKDDQKEIVKSCMKIIKEVSGDNKMKKEKVKKKLVKFFDDELDKKMSIEKVVKKLRKGIYEILKDLPEYLPCNIIDKFVLPSAEDKGSKFIVEIGYVSYEGKSK